MRGDPVVIQLSEDGNPFAKNNGVRRIHDPFPTNKSARLAEGTVRSKVSFWIQNKYLTPVPINCSTAFMRLKNGGCGRVKKSAIETSEEQTWSQRDRFSVRFPSVHDYIVLDLPTKSSFGIIASFRVHDEESCMISDAIRAQCTVRYITNSGRVRE